MVVVCALRTVGSVPCGPPPSSHTAATGSRDVDARGAAESPRRRGRTALWRCSAQTIDGAGRFVVPPGPASIVTEPGVRPLALAVIWPGIDDVFDDTGRGVGRTTVPPPVDIAGVTPLFTGLPSGPSGTVATFDPTSKEISPSP
jgi:hypothetical protein